MWNQNSSFSGIHLRLLRLYVSLIGLLIGLVVTTMTGLEGATGVAVLFTIGAGSVFTYFHFTTRPWVLITFMLYGLALMVGYANDLMMLWFPNLKTLLAFAWYTDLSPVIVICMAAAYPAFHRWRQRSAGGKT